VLPLLPFCDTARLQPPPCNTALTSDLNVTGVAPACGHCRLVVSCRVYSPFHASVYCRSTLDVLPGPGIWVCARCLRLLAGVCDALVERVLPPRHSATVGELNEPRAWLCGSNFRSCPAAARSCALPAFSSRCRAFCRLYNSYARLLVEKMHFATINAHLLVTCLTPMRAFDGHVPRGRAFFFAGALPAPFTCYMCAFTRLDCLLHPQCALPPNMFEAHLALT